MLSSARWILLIAVLAAPGCAVMRTVGLLQEPETDAKNHHLAKAAWKRHEPYYEGMVACEDFARGWKAGYFDVASGRDGCLPLIPPARYRGARYQTPAGHARAQAWFDGFEEGASVAHDEGIGAFAYVPTRRPYPLPRVSNPSGEPTPAELRDDEAAPPLLEPLPPERRKRRPTSPRESYDDPPPRTRDAAPSAADPRRGAPTETPPRLTPIPETPSTTADDAPQEFTQSDLIDEPAPMMDEETDAAVDSLLEQFGIEPEEPAIEAPGVLPEEPRSLEPPDSGVEPAIETPEESPSESNPDGFQIEDLFGAAGRPSQEFDAESSRPAPFVGEPGRLVGMRISQPATPAAEVRQMGFQQQAAQQPTQTVDVFQPKTPPTESSPAEPPPRRSAWRSPAAAAAALQALGQGMDGPPARPAARIPTKQNHDYESGESRPGAIDFEAKQERDHRNRTLEALDWIDA